MRHRRRDVALREAVERSRLRVGRALREDGADEPVVTLDVRLLAGGIGPVVEHEGEPTAVGVELESGWETRCHRSHLPVWEQVDATTPGSLSLGRTD